MPKQKETSGQLNKRAYLGNHVTSFVLRLVDRRGNGKALHFASVVRNKVVLKSFNVGKWVQPLLVVLGRQDSRHPVVNMGGERIGLGNDNREGLEDLSLAPPSAPRPAKNIGSPLVSRK